MIHAKQDPAKFTCRSAIFAFTGAKLGWRVRRVSERSWRRLSFDDAQCHFVDEGSGCGEGMADPWSSLAKRPGSRARQRLAPRRALAPGAWQCGSCRG